MLSHGGRAAARSDYFNNRSQMKTWRPVGGEEAAWRGVGGVDLVGVGRG